jgi:hypothetical protein
MKGKKRGCEHHHHHRHGNEGSSLY